MTAIVDDVGEIRRDILMRRLVEVIHHRCFPDGAAIPLDFLVPLELLSEIGTDDDELGDLFAWLWSRAQSAIFAQDARGDRIAADETQLRAQVYGELAERYHRRALLRRGNPAANGQADQTG